MQTIKIKPLSVNEAWQGRRFKTDKYKKYERMAMLSIINEPMPKYPYKVKLVFGISKSSDIDNPIKPFLDILQKKFAFNDKHITALDVGKRIVKKGNEFISFSITRDEETH